MGKQGFEKIAADPEKIGERNEYDNHETNVKPELEPQDPAPRRVFVVPLEADAYHRIKNEVGQRDNGIVDTIY